MCRDVCKREREEREREEKEFAQTTNIN
jgi:hypothetical protein